MDDVLLIVRGQGVNDDVDPHPESCIPLKISPRSALADPLSIFVSGPGPGQIVLRINDRRPGIDGDAFKVWIDNLAASEAADEIEALIDGMVRKKSP